MSAPEVEPFLLRPLSTGLALFFASVGVALAVVAYYEHFRRKETPQAVGFGLATLGLFLWAGFRGPIYFVLVIPAVAALVPWLIWGRKPRAVRAALLARSPILIQRRERPTSAPQGVRGVLDFKRDGERAMFVLMDVMEKMSKEMGRQQKRLPKHGRRMERALARGASTERAYRLADKAAKDVEAHGADMAALEHRLRTGREQMISNFTDWLRSQGNTPQANQLRAGIRDMGRATGVARRGAESYRKVAADLRQQNLSISVNRAADRLDAALVSIVEDIRAIERFCQPQGRRR